jgi:hypothetical protein
MPPQQKPNATIAVDVAGLVEVSLRRAAPPLVETSHVEPAVVFVCPLTPPYGSRAGYRLVSGAGHPERRRRSGLPETQAPQLLTASTVPFGVRPGTAADTPPLCWMARRGQRRWTLTRSRLTADQRSPCNPSLTRNPSDRELSLAGRSDVGIDVLAVFECRRRRGWYSRNLHRRVCPSPRLLLSTGAAMKREDQEAARRIRDCCRLVSESALVPFLDVGGGQSWLTSRGLARRPVSQPR